MRLLRWQLPLKRAWTMGSGHLFYCVRTRSFAISASAAECLQLIKVRFFVGFAGVSTVCAPVPFDSRALPSALSLSTPSWGADDRR